jgi:hypothetical protein
MADGDDTDEYLYKVLVVGEVRVRLWCIIGTYLPGSSTCVLVKVGTGKTSLVRKFVHNTFTNNYKSTIGELQPLQLQLRKKHLKLPTFHTTFCSYNRCRFCAQAHQMG